MDNPLLKHSAKDYFFKAALCHFIVDELNAKVSAVLCTTNIEIRTPQYPKNRQTILLVRYYQ